MIDINILNKLNASTREERIANLREVMKAAPLPPRKPKYINNHIHTTYSFSPYSPTASVFASLAEGLCRAGIIDHDSISGAEEFLEAAKICELPATIGMECRVSMRNTEFANRRTNNPDQVGISYMTIQSVPHNKISVLDEFFAPYREARNRRNRKMVDNINALLPDVGLDFERDVLPLSLHSEGGSVTERHLMYALAKKLTEQTGKGDAMISRLFELGLKLSDKQKSQMSDTDYPFYEYDLLGILKGAFVPKIYVDADEECPSLCDVVALCKKVDACLAYAYLGDVTSSVTGDKAAQKFEDDYLDELFAFLHREGVRAITYMPTRNTKDQLIRLRTLCDDYKMFQISGEDINSPRQSFIIRAMEDEMFSNLIDATWQLIRHEENGEKLPIE